MTLRAPDLRGSRAARLGGVTFASALALTVAACPSPAAGQLSDSCSVTCALTLGATSVASATGTVVAWGRHTGGVSTAEEAVVVWGTGLVVYGGAGIALRGNGERQRRAVYAAGLGAVTGSLLGLAIGAISDESGGAPEVAATLMGAAAGAMLAGIYGALSHGGQEAEAGPFLSLRLHL